MAQKYAKGSRAWGICGRSGKKMLLRDMVFDERYPNMRVDPDWWEGKHPQEFLPKVEDPVALYRPAVEVVSAPYAPILTVTPLGTAPPVLTASVVLGPALLLMWTVSPALAATAVSYLLYRATGDGAFSLLATITAPLEQYTDTTVTGGNTYSYFVVAVDNIGSQTAPSNVLSEAGTVVDVYTGNAVWAKRPTALRVSILAIADGGGGGGGQNFFLSGTPSGGGGGSGGGYAQITGVDASTLPDLVTVTVGQGGAGGAPGSQLLGNVGTGSSFGTFVVCTGGGAGAGAGQGNSGLGGLGSVHGITGTITTAQGGLGAPGFNTPGTGNDGNSNNPAPAGGGAGFRRTVQSGGPSGNGGACGLLAGGAGGTAGNPGQGGDGSGGNSGLPTTIEPGSGGGGGGDAFISSGPIDVFGGNGGPGGLYGAGGGGGGYADANFGGTQNATGGGGGHGAPGVVVVTTALW